jgi:hypothetical protein
MIGRYMTVLLMGLCMGSLLVQVRVAFQDTTTLATTTTTTTTTEQQQVEKNRHHDDAPEFKNQAENKTTSFLRGRNQIAFKWDILNGTLSNNFIDKKALFAAWKAKMEREKNKKNEEVHTNKESENVAKVADKAGFPDNQTILSEDSDSSFSACLITMDDNHYLIEWLAYHEHYLPLRRLIVAIDPRSRTSPLKIFNRYKGRINITVWNDADFMPDHLKESHKLIPANDTKQLTDLYLKRQVYFYNSCLRTLHAENKTWTAVIDSDEFIQPNDRAMFHGILRKKEATMIDTLQQSENKEGITSHLFSDSCVRIPRIRYGTKESEYSKVQNMVPEGFQGQDFLTMRWRWHRKISKAHRDGLEKTVVDLSKVENVSIFDRPWQNVNPHRAIRSLCKLRSKADPPAYAVEAPWIINHYFGSFEQWSFRNDPRDWVRQNKTEYDEFIDIADEEDDSIRWWLEDFVRQNGKNKAQALLEDVGSTA